MRKAIGEISARPAPRTASTPREGVTRTDCDRVTASSASDVSLWTRYAQMITASLPDANKYIGLHAYLQERRVLRTRSRWSVISARRPIPRSLQPPPTQPNSSFGNWVYVACRQ